MKPTIVSPMDYVSEKFLKLPNVKRYEVISKENKKFLSEIEMDDGYVFEMTGIVSEQIYPGMIEDILKKNKDVTVIVGPYVSERTAEICMDKKIGFFDYCGNCYYVGHSIYLREKGNKNVVQRKSRTDAIFEKSSVVSSRILRTLFSDVSKYWKIKYLSEEIGCSIGQVSKVISYLQRNAWIQKSKNGYKLTDPEGLLREWSNIYGKSETSSISVYSLNTPADLEKKIAEMQKEKDIKCYLTGFSGGVRYAPVVRYNKVHVYMYPEDITQAMEYLDLKEVDSGSNVTIYCIENDVVLKDAAVIDGNNVVSPVQIYLDVIRMKGRGEELANAIYKREIQKNDN